MLKGVEKLQRDMRGQNPGPTRRELGSFSNLSLPITKLGEEKSSTHIEDLGDTNWARRTSLFLDTET